MSSLFRLKQADNYYKFAVFGFVREAEHDWKLPSIPTMMTYVCLSYYFVPEFIAKAEADCFELSNDRRTAAKISSDGKHKHKICMNRWVDSMSSLIIKWRCQIRRNTVPEEWMERRKRGAPKGKSADSSKTKNHANVEENEPTERRIIKNPILISRKYTAIACVECWRAKTRCQLRRPCDRCVRLGRAEKCVDRPPVSRRRHACDRRIAVGLESGEQDIKTKLFPLEDKEIDGEVIVFTLDLRGATFWAHVEGSDAAFLVKDIEKKRGRSYRLVFRAPRYGDSVTLKQCEISHKE
mmetsp:Transcript_68697/g.109119  ORF Transcript_68697/g.109119 Transcript_68697/m.109119 type:complete len:295 (+) Transcript_68697:55-939(+)